VTTLGNPQVTRIASLEGVTGVENDRARAVWDVADAGAAADWAELARQQKKPPATDCTTLDNPLGNGPFPEVEPYYLKQVRRVWVCPRPGRHV
jgi:hypothetical protein